MASALIFSTLPSLLSRGYKEFVDVCHKLQKIIINIQFFARMIIAIENQYHLARLKVAMFGNFSLSILCDSRIANLPISGSHF